MNDERNNHNTQQLLKPNRVTKRKLLQKHGMLFDEKLLRDYLKCPQE